jgi:hypothetical protein
MGEINMRQLTPILLFIQEKYLIYHYAAKRARLHFALYPERMRKE